MSNQLPAPAAEGTLSKTPFAHIVLYVVQRNMTGTLAVWPDIQDGRKEDRIFFENGYIVAARMVESAAALDRGLLPVFARAQAPFVFYEGVNLVGNASGALVGRVDAYALVTASVRGPVREDAVEAVLSKFGTSPVRIKQGTDLARFQFTQKESSFIEVMRAEPASIIDLMSAGGLPEKTARKFLYLLAITKTIESYGAVAPSSSSTRLPQTGGTSPAIRLPTSGGTSPGMKAPGTNPAIKLPPAKPTPAAAPASSAAEPAFEERLTFSIAEPEAVHVAQSAAAPLPDLPAAAGDMSFEDMPMPSLPPAPSAAAAKKKSNPPVAAANLPARVKKPAPPRPPQPPMTMSQDLAAKWQRLADRCVEIDGQNYLEMLGVQKDATSAIIREKYFELMKTFHPDRLPPEFSGLAEFVRTAFEHLTAANETLSDGDKRTAYIRGLAGGGGSPADERKMIHILEATVEHQKAEIMFKRREYAAALVHIENAIELNPEEADYHAFRSWTLFSSSAEDDEAATEIMLKAADEAVRLNAGSDRTHYYRGLILRRAGRDPEAIGAFRKAAEINPRNTDAVREVRLADMREKKPTTEKSDKGGAASVAGGLLGKLFKKS